MGAKFGPAGMCELAAQEKVKHTVALMTWLKEKDLDAFEYQCGRGVNIKQEKAEEIASAARENDIALSVHAPYFISLASAEEEKRDNSVGYILKSAEAAKWLGAKRIVVHPGGIGKMKREEATALACETLKKAIAALDENGLGDIIMCPEVMGKINQLGDVDEVLTFCALDERMLPCVDFGHLNSRTHGGMKTVEDYYAVFDKIENKLGHERLDNMHIHFSRIEYSAGGEVRHLTFEDTVFGPEQSVFIEAVRTRGISPTVICESAGTQTLDSMAMKSLYIK